MSVWQDDYKWHCDYIQLVTDAGFTFGRRKFENFDKSKLAYIDIESIIKDRNIGIVEKYIPMILQFVLDQEQIELLDSNFVKVFQMSQLCIEYLLYCKKHLDKTVFSLKEDYKKLENENKELNEFAEELKGHIARLTKDLKPPSIFQCNECNKFFSTEEYLTAHIKRRHTHVNVDNPIKNDHDTDRLQSEIKELKGRLNSTEKLLQQYQNEIKSIEPSKDNDKDVVINDLQQKFDNLRQLVEYELKNLQKQYNFEEKCEKFFGLALENIEQLKTRKNSNNEIEGVKIKREITTQTDDINDESKKIDEKIDQIDDTERQIKEIGESLDTKVTSSLQKIENQMQSFWSKLHEIEKAHKNANVVEEVQPPIVKPRTKLTSNQIEHQQILEGSEKSPVKVRQRQRWIKRDNINEKPIVVEVARNDSNNSGNTTESDKDGDDDDDDDDNNNNNNDGIVEKNKDFNENKSPVQNDDSIMEDSPKIEKKSPVHVPEPPKSVEQVDFRRKLEKERQIRIFESKKSSVRKVQEIAIKESSKSHQSDKRDNKKPIVDAEMLEMFQTQIEDIVKRRLQDLGISPEWKGIPLKTYQKASEIIEHQANLTKKTLPNFDRISRKIEREINKNLEGSFNNRHDKNRKKDGSSGGGGGYKKFTKSTQRTPPIRSRQIEIKNRKLYETDSESVDGVLNETKPATRYSAVIEELKSKSKLLDPEQTRGVLKNYTSYAALTKKRVNFNLKSDDIDDHNRKNVANKLAIKDGGSTTSIGSSILDAPPKKIHDNINELEDISDFDL